ncbi:hypothetical protein MSAN_00198700 [Mycena sanguinolenta]|uniref:Uncharacterized protein n=1 Tax=Mycena sanguinolenta TaxID=230812 RepID=A0A8H7DLD5_9AGAR|nr:hypothetical protein MSAN_00198700 [Mycena sanguinolenta]
MSLVHTRRAITPTVSKMRNFPARKVDGGMVGNWPRNVKVFQVSGFDATRLRASDLIDIPRSLLVYLDVHGHYPSKGRQMLFYALSFRAADSHYTRRDTRLRGFLYYHLPIPSRPLSGGLRFRCTPSLTAFPSGMDLLSPSGLPWAIPLANLVRRGSLPVTQSLLRDNLVSFPDLLACHRTFHHKPHPLPPVVHAVGQPWFLDLSAPSAVFVPGPHSLLRCEIYPAVASYGAALVCFEYTGNPRSPHELAIRVLELRSNISLHPRFGHLPPVEPGALLARPNHSNGKPEPWTWNYDSHSTRMAAALYALVHGPTPVPGTPADFPLSEDSDMPSAPGMYPTRRQRVTIEHWFYSALPNQKEVARYSSRKRGG